MKQLIVDAGAILVGNIVFDKFIGKVEGSDSGFILVQPGIGLDDAVRAITCVAAVWLARKFI